MNHSFAEVSELQALPAADSLKQGPIAFNWVTGLISDGDASYGMYFNIELFSFAPLTD